MMMGKSRGNLKMPSQNELQGYIHCSVPYKLSQLNCEGLCDWLHLFLLLRYCYKQNNNVYVI